jgi:two-component system OmpR family response regulator
MNRGTEKLKVLIADDEADIAETVKYCLEQEGCEVQVASNGHEAIGIIRAWQPHVALLDVMMPGENGYRVSRFAKEDVDRGVITPLSVVLVTARKLDDPERERTFSDFSRCDAIVYKPFDIEELIALVREKSLVTA